MNFNTSNLHKMKSLKMISLSGFKSKNTIPTIFENGEKKRSTGIEMFPFDIVKKLKDP